VKAMNEEFETQIIEYLKENKWVKAVTPTEIAGVFKKTHQKSKDALESLWQQKRLYTHDISSKERVGDGTATHQPRKYPDPFFLYYLPSGEYLRSKRK
jgi:hypothetical protein